MRMVPWVARLVLALSLVLALAACGAPPAPPTSTAAPAKAAAPEAAAPKAAAPPAEVAETVTIALPGDLTTIDPHQTRSVLVNQAISLVYETLISRDPKTMELKPQLATSWKNVDNLTWEVKLREGIKFANGEEFDAQHARASLERGLAPKLNSSVKTYWGSNYTGSFEAVDKYTLRARTPEPDPLVPGRLAPSPVTMATKAVSDLMEKYVTAPDQAIGTGPYRFVEHKAGNSTSLERREDYWGQKPPTKKIVFKIVPDSQTRVAALERGEVDIMENLPVPLISTVEKNSSLAAYKELGSTTHAVLINTKKGGPLANEKVRQAMNYAIDRETILKTLYAGGGKVLKSVIAEQVGKSGGEAYNYDPRKAKALLAEAGYPNGFETVFWQAEGRWEMAVEAAQAIAGFWQDVGIKTEVKILEWGEYQKRSTVADFDTLSYGARTNLLWDASYPFLRFTPDYGKYEFYTAEGDTLESIKKLMSTFEAKERASLAERISGDLTKQGAWIYLYQLDESFGLNRKVKGFMMRPDNEIYLLGTYREK